MENTKICFKSDGTEETGAKIIKALEELGGINRMVRTGCGSIYIYYYIRKDSIIDNDDNIPKDYTLKDIHTWKQETLSKDKPFYVIVTEENRDVLSKWIEIKSIKINQIVGLSLWYNKDLQKGHNETKITEGKNYTLGNEISFEQFLELYPEYKEEAKPKFEIGKWYKNLGSDLCHIAKFSGWDGNTMKASEYIYTKSNIPYCGLASDNFTSDYKNAELLIDLSEIQEYLPDGHPDKILETPTPEVVYCETQEEWDFIRSLYGQVKIPLNTSMPYLRVDVPRNGSNGTYDNPNPNYKIYPFKEWCDKFGHKPDFMNNKNKFKAGDYIVITECNYPSYNGTLNYCYKLIDDRFHFEPLNRIPLEETAHKKARYATAEEIEEYDRLGKPYDVTTLQSEEVIPEYVEVLANWDRHKAGKIYKTSEPCPVENKNWNKSWTWEYLLTSNEHKSGFKPSTKEAYEAQFITEESEFVLPEKWCIKDCPIVTQWAKDNFNKNISDTFDHGKYFCKNATTYYFLTKKKADVEGYVEITFEQFKKYVLKETIEEEWIPQVGDYVVSLEDKPGYRKKGDIFRILRFVNGGSHIYYLPETNGSLSSFRKATAQEVHEQESGYSSSAHVKPIEEYIPGQCGHKSNWVTLEEEKIQRQAREDNMKWHLANAGLEVNIHQGNHLETWGYTTINYSKPIENCLYKKSKSKLFSTFVEQVKEVKIPLTKEKTSKLITNK